MADLKIGDICLSIFNYNYLYKIIDMTEDKYEVVVFGMESNCNYFVEKKAKSLIIATKLAKLLYG